MNYVALINQQLLCHWAVLIFVSTQTIHKANEYSIIVSKKVFTYFHGRIPAEKAF